jgi:DnaJ family protein A protein 2
MAMQVYVTPGTLSYSRLTLPGQGDEAPGWFAGDLIFVITEEAHPSFKRSNDDLFTTVSLTLLEALTGFTRVIQHLDRRKLVLRSRPGEVFSHNSVRVFQGQGMPNVSNPMTRGRLFVRFQVQFPAANNLSEHALTSCCVALPQPKLEIENDAPAQMLQECDDMVSYCSSAHSYMDRYFG